MAAVLRSILKKRTLLSINPTHYRTLRFEGESPKKRVRVTLHLNA